jgi:hypothetical protein
MVTLLDPQRHGEEQIAPDVQPTVEINTPSTSSAVERPDEKRKLVIHQSISEAAYTKERTAGPSMFSLLSRSISISSESTSLQGQESRSSQPHSRLVSSRYFLVGKKATMAAHLANAGELCKSANCPFAAFSTLPIGCYGSAKAGKQRSNFPLPGNVTRTHDGSKTNVVCSFLLRKTTRLAFTDGTTWWRIIRNCRSKNTK